MKNKKVWIAAGVLSLALGVGLYSSGTIFQGAFKPLPASDRDGDGIKGSADLCPLQNATGYDLNLDGCIDDTDGDSIKDNVDLCPTIAAVSGYDLDSDGCTDDTDGDTITDDLDACPTVAAVSGYDLDTDGCTDNTDGDTITDDLDACPTVAAVSGYDLDTDGCTDDADGDGITDDIDACPTEDATGHDMYHGSSDGCIDATITVDPTGAACGVDLGLKYSSDLYDYDSYIYCFTVTTNAPTGFHVLLNDSDYFSAQLTSSLFSISSDPIPDNFFQINSSYLRDRFHSSCYATGYVYGTFEDIRLYCPPGSMDVGRATPSSPLNVWIAVDSHQLDLVNSTVENYIQFNLDDYYDVFGAEIYDLPSSPVTVYPIVD
jgi:hypothetical protein